MCLELGSFLPGYSKSKDFASPLGTHKCPREEKIYNHYVFWCVKMSQHQQKDHEFDDSQYSIDL